MPDFVQPFFNGDPRQIRKCTRRPWDIGLVFGIDRVYRKYMLDIGQHQFLVLLLVMKPDLDQGGDDAEQFLIAKLHQSDHTRIDVISIAVYILYAGTR